MINDTQLQKVLLDKRFVLIKVTGGYAMAKNSVILSSANTKNL